MSEKRTMKTFLLCVYILIFSFKVHANLCMSKSNQLCRTSTKFCNELCVNNICEIRAAVILPSDTNLSISSIPDVMPLLQKAIDDAYKAEIIPKWLKITLIPKDDRCEASHAQIAIIDLYSNSDCPHVIFGPVCDYCLASVSRIVKFFGTPLLTAGGFSNDFDKEKVTCADEYYMLVRTGTLVFKGLSQFFKRIANSYEWRKVAFLYDKEGQRQVAGESTCSLMMQAMAHELKEVRGFQYKDGDLGLSTFNISEFLRKDIGVNYGVIVTCASRERVHDILLAATELENMVQSGEYVFFNIELNSSAPHPERPWIEKNIIFNAERTEKLKTAYMNVLTLTSLSEEINNVNESATIRSKTNYASGFYDAMTLFLKTVKHFLRIGGKKANLNTTINGYELVCNMYNTTFQGLNGEVHINHNGDRTTHYSLLSYNPTTEIFDVVANYSKGDAHFTFNKGKKIYWHNREKPPLDTPSCGYDNSKCQQGDYIIPVLIAVLFLIMCILICAAVKCYMLEKNKNQAPWILKKQDIEKLSSDSLKTVFEGNFSTGVSMCTYKGNACAFKVIEKQQSFSRDEKIHLRKVYELQHEYVVKFIGLYVDSLTHYILLEYCEKGSLREFLQSEKMQSLRGNFEVIQISFINDLILGMHYLHQSEIKTHGVLTSSNCVINSRLVVKIVDHGLHFLYRRNERPKDEKYWTNQLYQAPELLRDKNPPIRGTQKGDVYAFAVIMHEIMERKGPFYMSKCIKGPGGKVTEIQILAKDIVESIKPGNFVRPPVTQGSKEITDLMKKCWAENEAERPDFSVLKNTIKKLNRDHESGDMMDNLLSRLEQYANNLEQLVEDRTKDYVEEKKKCENLLYQLLPKEVALQLITGTTLIAESYDQVTIYFSDIVDFTALSASSKPMEIVELLNDLYTCFDNIIENYDVYKVETIGDAYMVVSGLPVRNGNSHAREIARVALSVMELVQSFVIKHRKDEPLRVRVGMHTGPCVAGVVGHKMPRYCLFGDTVNTASRLETNGLPQRIHVSPTTKDVLDTFGNFELEERGLVELKGKGKMTTYWLISEKAEPVSLTAPKLSVTQEVATGNGSVQMLGQTAVVYVENPVYIDREFVEDDGNVSPTAPLLSFCNEKH